MTPEPELELLRRWHAGDRAALHQLLAATLPWLHKVVGQAMGPEHRKIEDSMDLVQSAALKFLLNGPRFLPTNGAQFKALLKRIAINELIDHQRRSGRARALDGLDSQGGYGESVLNLAGAERSSLSPSRVAERQEERAWLRLALEFLPPEERRLLVASEVEGLDWATIAREFEMPSSDAARVRAARSLPKLANLVRKLKAGQMQTLLDQDAGAVAS